MLPAEAASAEAAAAAGTTLRYQNPVTPATHRAHREPLSAKAGGVRRARTVVDSRREHIITPTVVTQIGNDC